MRGLVLRERESIAAVWKVISSELAGKPLAAARRSHGSMFLLEFGQLTRVKDLDRTRYKGEWTLLVEWSDWIMEFANAPKLSAESDNALIDRTLPKLRRKAVRHIMFDRRERLIIRLEDGTRLVVSGTGGPRRGDPLRLWCLHRKRKGYDSAWTLTYECDRRLVLRTGR